MYWRILFSLLIVLLGLWALQRLFAAEADKRKNSGGNGLRPFVRGFILQAWLNPLLRYLGLRPVWLPPAGVDQEKINLFLDRTRALLDNLEEALAHNPHLVSGEKQDIFQRALETGDNIVELGWTSVRLRRLQKVIPPEDENHDELKAMLEKLFQEMENAVQVLQNVPVSIIKLELSSEEPGNDEFLDELQETNQRMQDLIKAHESLRKD